MSKSISLASGRMRSSAISFVSSQSVFIVFNLLDELLVQTVMTLISVPISILICYLCVKRRMVPFGIAFKSGFYAIFMCWSVSKNVHFV